ncbi:MAG: class I SAM-dependent methyltransferase [Hyphomicrobiales bacterium]
MTEAEKIPASDQKWAADDYDQNARFVSDLAGGVFSWLAPQPGETILDIGCGDGAVTEQIAATGARVTGIDSSEHMLAAAKDRGLDVHFLDAHALEFDSEFDAVFSNAALHWMLNPDAVIKGVHRALKPGGRFVAEFGGHGNVAAIITAMRAVEKQRGGDAAITSPWYFPTPDEYREKLEAHGFHVRQIGLFPRPTPIPSGMKAWLKTFRTPFFTQFGADADAILDEVTALLAPSLCDDRGNWTADYVRLRVEAHRD